MKSFLASLPVAGLGGRLLVISRSNIVETFIQAVCCKYLPQYHETISLIILRQMSQLKLLTIETQVAFVVTDSNQDTDTTHWAALAEEVLYCTVLYCTALYCTVQGQNLAFITRLPVSGGECDWGLRCVASSLGSLLVAGHEAALSEEMELFQQVSEEQHGQ